LFENKAATFATEQKRSKTHDLKQEPNIFMSDEIQEFVSSLKKTRDFSAFANAQTSLPKNKITNTENSQEPVVLRIEPSHDVESEQASNAPMIQVAESLKESKKSKKTGVEKDLQNRAISTHEDLPKILDTRFIEQVNHAHEQGRYNFSQKKRLEIDDKVHELLMQLKYHCGIKSISVFNNVVLSAFIQSNREELKQILSENALLL
jgi:hypothetical protein